MTIADRIWGILYTAVLVAVAVFMFMHVVPLNLPHSSPNPPVKFEDGWVSEDGQVISCKELYKVAKEPGEAIVLKKQLPDHFYSDSYLNFLSGNVNVIAMIDDRVIYSFEGTDPLGYPGTEAYYNHVRMDKGYANQTLTLIVTPAYTNSSSFMDDMVICSVDDFTLYLLQNYGIALFMSLTIVFLGFLMIIQFFALPREFHAYNTFALGVSSIAIGIWCAIETHLPMILFGKLTMVLIMLDNVIMFFMVSPLIVFFSSAISHRAKFIERISYAASALGLLLFAYCTVYCGISIYSSTFIFYSLFAFTIILGIVAGVRSELMVRKDPSTRKIDTLTLVAVLICAISLVAYFIVYLFSSRVDIDSIEILRIGFIVTQVVLVGGFMRKGTANSRAAAESELMRKLAYVDALTGVGNRAAYNIASDKLDAQAGKDGFDFLFACFDVDDLKRINDTFGHECGDDHIIAASGLLVESFGEYGQVYRIGGDEFTMLITDADDYRAVYESGVKRLRALEAEYNVEHPDKTIRISTGACCLSEAETKTMREVANIADKAMYQDKVTHKKSNGNAE